ncbi:MAG TPA: hypothetical protein VHP33_10655 [Polyangiaceae bacterium]|nr:hypothetical protein [Polyangiaceae bacterium]
MHAGANSGVRLVGMLVPVVFVATMAMPRQGELPLGIHEALGCSGTGSGSVAPPEPSWFSLTAADAVDPTATLRVDTDGFVAFIGSSYGLTAEQELAGIQLVVTDGAGAEVPGTLARLGTDPGRYGWTASEPLAVGTRLTAALTTTPTLDPANAHHTYTLEVIGAPAVPQPAAAFADWDERYRGTGGMLSCPVAPGTCTSPSTAMVPSTFEAAGGSVALRFDGLPPSGVAWDVTIAQSATHPDSTLWNVYRAFVTGPNSTSADLGGVGFGVDSSEACALVIVKDLRTGKEVSGESCSAKQPATTVSTESSLRECTEPPNQAVRSLWCQVRFGKGKPCSDETPDVTDPNPITEGNTADTTRHESGGCQLGHGGSLSAWLVPGAALAFAVLRRRRTSAR